MPWFAREILQRNTEWNFRGLLVGNPYVDPFIGTIGEFEAFYHHGLLAKPLYDQWADDCQSPETYESERCDNLTIRMLEQFGADDAINPYAIDYPVCLEHVEEKDHRPASYRQRMYNGEDPTRRTSSAQVDTLLHHWAPPFAPPQDDYQPCSQLHWTNYLNQPNVQKALGVKHPTEWSMCFPQIEYNQTDVATSSVPVLQEIVGQIEILVFSGDDDAICATAGTQRWIWGLAEPQHIWKPWRVQGQTAGFCTRFDQNLTFCTVHGAGHEVPAYRPMEALALFTKFLGRDW